MYHLLFLEEDQETIDKIVTPLLSGTDFEKNLYTEDLTFKDESKVIAYLPHQLLKNFLMNAATQKWEIGVLPHPKSTYVQRGLGTSANIERALNNIMDSKKSTSVDLITCNGQPIFQSLKTGNVFLIEEEKVQANLFVQVFRIFKNIWSWGSLSHKTYNFSNGEEKIINTSALGVIVLAHAGGAALAERSKNTGSINSGFLNLLILSPQSIFEMLFFLVKSIVPGVKLDLSNIDFIGYIKTRQIEIKSSAEFEYSIDGEKFKSESINLNVQPKALNLMQPSIFANATTSDDKNSFKIGGLPTGSQKEELIKNTMSWLPRAALDEFKELFTVLRENAKTTPSFIVLMALSTMMAAFGLYGNSSPVIIGAMILAPLMAPIISFSMAMVRYDVSILKTSVKTILYGTLMALLFSAFVSLIIPLQKVTTEMSARMYPTLLDLGIAVAAGIAGAYAHAKEEIAKSLAGVAIAVALVPPIAVAGIGFGWLDWAIFSGAFLLYLTNLSGIIMAAGLTFLILGYAPFTRAKRGLLYSFLILLIICIPLSFSFKKIMTEAEISKLLEGYTYNEITMTEVSVRPGKTIHISMKLVSSKILDEEEKRAIKKDIEQRLDREIKLEIVTATLL
jgi:uncharacterized hydrophobic protein (TIGR00271 family)